MNKEDAFDKAAEALTDAQKLAIINADSDTMMSVAGWWVELFDRMVAIEVMEKDGKKTPMGFTYAVGGTDDEHDED